jgi:hypothetical protein
VEIVLSFQERERAFKNLTSRVNAGLLYATQAFIQLLEQLALLLTQ